MPAKKIKVIICIICLLFFTLFISSCRGNEEEPVNVTRILMDTRVDLTLHGVSEERGNDLAAEVFAEMVRLEEILSAHVAGSDVYKINRQAGVGAVEVSQDTFCVIERFLEMARLTEGAFDATIAPVLYLWGFGQGEQSVPDENDLQEALDLVDYNDVILQDGNKVKLAREGMKLDLGGIAKGYIVDKGLSVLEDKGVDGAFLNAGGDINIMGSKPDGTPWRVGIRDPIGGSGMLAVLNIESGAVASSGDYERFFEEKGTYYHHIIDPFTGYPTEGISGVTIVADDCTTADILTTAIFVMGVEEGIAFLEGSAGVEGVIVDDDGEVYYTTGLEGKLEF